MMMISTPGIQEIWQSAWWNTQSMLKLEQQLCTNIHKEARLGSGLLFPTDHRNKLFFFCVFIWSKMNSAVNKMTYDPNANNQRRVEQDNSTVGKLFRFFHCVGPSLNLNASLHFYKGQPLQTKAHSGDRGGGKTTSAGRAIPSLQRAILRWQLLIKRWPTGHHFHDAAKKSLPLPRTHCRGHIAVKILPRPLKSLPRANCRLNKGVLERHSWALAAILSFHIMKKMQLFACLSCSIRYIWQGVGYFLSGLAQR